jgi:hypothetical protein
MCRHDTAGVADVPPESSTAAGNELLHVSKPPETKGRWVNLVLGPIVAAVFAYPRWGRTAYGDLALETESDAHANTEIETMMRKLRGVGWWCAALLVSMCARSAHAAPSGADEPRSSTPEPSVSHISEIVYLTPEVGIQYVGLETLHLTRKLVPSSLHSADVGPLFGVGAGFRFLFLTVGPRFRFGHFRDWDFWTLDAEVGFKVPLGAVEPYLALGGGYARLGSLQKVSLQDPGARVQGYNIRLNAGLDYYFDKMFSIGGVATGELLGMTRPGVDLNQATGSVSEDVYKLDGSSVGVAIMASAVVGLHL